MHSINSRRRFSKSLFVRAGAKAEALERRQLLTAIASGQTISASISTAKEVDSYTFSGKTGGSVIVNVADTSNNAFFPLVELFSPTNVRIAASTSQTGAAVASYNLAASGTYTVKVSDNPKKTAGNYNITLANLPGTPIAGDAGPISSGQTRSAAIGAGDSDIFTIHGTTGGSLIATVSDKSNNAFVALLEVFDPSGKRIGASAGQVGSASANYNLAQTGTYYVTVRDNTGITPASYDITVASLAGTQQAGGDGGPISSGQTRSGNVGPGDLDIFTINGTVSGSILVSVGDTSNNAFFPLIEVFDPSGKRIAASSGQVGSATASYNIAQSGTYYVLVRDNTATTAGNYNITVASLPAAQQTGGDGGAFVSGQTRSGNVGPGDVDVFTISGTTGGAIETAVADTSNNAFFPLVEVFDPSGKRIAAATAQVGTGTASYNIAQTGTYYVTVRDNTSTTAGNYNLTVISIPGSQDAGGDAGFLPSGVTRNAKITAGDRDVHPFYAVTGDKIVLSTSEVGATAFFPLAELFDPSGKRIAAIANQTTAGPTTINSAPASGIYYYVVSDNTSTNTGSYSTLLTETPSATKPTVSIAAGSNATEGGGSGSFTITRTNIRALPITVNFTISGTAKNGTDYTSIATSVVIPANAGSVTISIKPINDPTDEPDETVILTLTGGSSYTIDSTKKTATIKVIDNDPTPLAAPVFQSAVSIATGAGRPSAWKLLEDDPGSA